MAWFAVDSRWTRSVRWLYASRPARLGWYALAELANELRTAGVIPDARDRDRAMVRLRDDLVAGLEVGDVLELLERDRPFRLEADVEDDHVVADLEHTGLDDLAFLDGGERPVVQVHHPLVLLGGVLVFLVELGATVGERALGRDGQPLNKTPNSLDHFEQDYGRSAEPMGKSAQAEIDVANLLHDGGPGTRVIILGDRAPITLPNGQKIPQLGHAFNGVNMDGHVFFVDGQSGKIITDWSRFGLDKIWIVRTN